MQEFIDACESASHLPGFSLAFIGRGAFDGRPTYVLQRRLPDDAPALGDGERLFVMHLDAEWLVPVACYVYTDHAGRNLLGRYLTTDVQFNVGLTDADF